MTERERDPSGAQDFEELDDEVIIAQETEAHSPAPRAQVATEQPTVVISDAPGPHRQSTVPPQRRRERTEKTVVIRDRKSLERLRREASRAPRRRRSSASRTVLLVGVAVLASLAAGTLLATLANSAGSGGTATASSAVEAEGPSAVSTASNDGPTVVDLEDLPVERTTKKKKTHASD